MEAILDKAVKALGGEEKLRGAKALMWKFKMEAPGAPGMTEKTSGQWTVQGIDQARKELETEDKGTKYQQLFVLDGNRGWSKTGEGKPTPFAAPLKTSVRREVNLEVLPRTILPLKGKVFKVKAVGQTTVEGKPAVGVLVTEPDDKEFTRPLPSRQFTLYFDKENGLPVKLVYTESFVSGRQTTEMSFRDYKDFDGIKVATRIDTRRTFVNFKGSSTREQQVEISDFRALAEVDAKTFAEPN